MILTERRKVEMKTEHARCLFKLSEAWEPRHEETQRLREDSERPLRELDPKAKNFGVERSCKHTMA